MLSRLRAEIDGIAGLGPEATQPSRAQLRKMKYLELVIRESMRLYPPVPVNARTAVKTTTLPVGGGLDGLSPILVRKGEAVSYSPYVIHRRKDIYGEDSLNYRPERWENGALKHVGYGYVPFNAGPRNCLGQNYALLEISYTVARLIQRRPFMAGPFDRALSDVGKEKQILTMVLLCDEGCRVRFGSEGSVEGFQRD